MNLRMRALLQPYHFPWGYLIPLPNNSPRFALSRSEEEGSVLACEFLLSLFSRFHIPAAGSTVQREYFQNAPVFFPRLVQPLLI